MRNFAVIVPIGPDAVELRRFHDFLESLWSYEQGASLCVAIDSSPHVRDVKPRDNRIPDFVTLRRPFGEQGEPLMGRLSASLLVGFDLIRRAGPFDFVLRADTDALIAGEFRDAVSQFLAGHPQTGMLGTLGFTCDRASPHYGCEKTGVSDVVPALEAMPHDSPGSARIEAQLNSAYRNGYVGKEYCQGGIYVLPFRTLERMFQFGCFEYPEDWLPLAVPEDVMMGMFTRTVGLESTDFSMPGEPFGSNWRGLAYSPEEMLRRGHALIHSVKSDPQYSELELRRFFKSHRDKLRK
ncbi:MAG: hypothetical protein ABSG51_12245 [Terracidiphilus sp.]|jgi:hypothetical protein